MDKSDFSIGYVSISEIKDNYMSQLKELGIKTYILNRSIKNPFSYIRHLTKIAKGYDIIHVHGNSATMVLEMIAAKIAKVPLRCAHSHNSTCGMRIINILAHPVFDTLCNGRLACGEKAGKWLHHDKDFIIIKNGIETDMFRFNQDKRLLIRKSLEWEKYIILANIANFVEAKNHEFLINVFAEIYKKRQDVRLLLFGIGPLMEKAQFQAKSLGIEDKILFAGSVSNISDYLSAIDLIIMPSKFEGLPLTLIEGQANGLDAIVSDAITRDADITGHLTFLPLGKGKDYWSEEIISRLNREIIRSEENSLASINMITHAGYDINSSAAKLKNYYTTKLKRHNG